VRIVREWRSALFVPANAKERIAKAHLRGADAIILDLEDAVLPAAKDDARSQLGVAVGVLSAEKVPVLIRVNSSWRELAADLGVAIPAGVRGLVIPKVEGYERVWAIADMVGEFESQLGLESGAIGLFALIEHPAALNSLDRITRIPRVRALGLGSEDFALAMGVAPTASILQPACQALAFAAAERGLAAYGLPISLAEFNDLEAYRAAAVQARAMGMTGAMCIHPSQVPVLNAVFAPSAKEILEAQRVVSAWQTAVAEGRSVVALDGRMVDKPVAERARRLLDRSRSDAAPIDAPALKCT